MELGGGDGGERPIHILTYICPVSALGGEGNSGVGVADAPPRAATLTPLDTLSIARGTARSAPPHLCQLYICRPTCITFLWGVGVGDDPGRTPVKGSGLAL